MAISIGAYTPPRSGTRGTFVTSGGTPYVILRDGTTIRCFKKTNASFSEQDSGDAPTCYTYDNLDARCDGSLIHVAYYSASTTVSYITFNTSTDQWGTAETVVSGLSLPATRRSAISLDSNDKPHVVYTDGVTYHGTGYDQIKYKNKTGASWSAEESVSTGAQVTNRYPTVGHESDDRFVVSWARAGVPQARTRSSAGSWDTEAPITAGVHPENGSLAITSDDKPNLAAPNTGGDLNYFEGTSGANPTWSETADLDTSIADPSIAANGTDLLVVYEEDTLNDILLIKRLSASWGSPEALAVGTMSTPCIQDPTDATGFDYIYKNDIDGNVYWDEYSFVAPDGIDSVDGSAKANIASVQGVAAANIGEINTIPW